MKNSQIYDMLIFIKIFIKRENEQFFFVELIQKNILILIFLTIFNK